ncbi:cytochrome c oxidase assembly protein [Caulobacter sp. 17J80-11]|uniref:cytochrome c oxidase assembly protein n=1 Tax=Caulobacter sp. 17J80-11 TaxID=2763502 RepID=UPI001653B495|nr:cytochrome c oxidase assembly protein [Caulobacter sp. 17J80-11]MBC6982560.1 cytochrome c oxidase assembly protein [Caulobacter sp. 17J80-11]
MSLRLALVFVLLAGPAFAHAGEPHAPIGWSLEPWIVAPLAAALAAFALGWTRLARRSARGGAGLRRRAWLFALGWLILAGAVVSPLHAAGQRSFTAHMLEHELMMLAAAPLLVASRPLAVVLWAFPAAARRSLGAVSRSNLVQRPWRVLTDPVVAALAQAAALWLWHAPVLFDRALAHEGWHATQHLSFLTTGLLFWTAMLQGAERRRGFGPAVLGLFVTSIISGALGALMAFSESPWYAPYAALGVTPFGLTPAEDQQLAGLLMWVPGGLVHAGAALALIGLSLSTRETAHAARR